jgi:hypothetical protein
VFISTAAATPSTWCAPATRRLACGAEPEDLAFFDNACHAAGSRYASALVPLQPL